MKPQSRPFIVEVKRRRTKTKPDISFGKLAVEQRSQLAAEDVKDAVANADQFFRVNAAADDVISSEA